MQDFKNDWYPVLLLLLLGAGILTAVQSLINRWDLPAILRLTLSASIILGIVTNLKYTGILVRILGGLSILGGVLGLISILMYLFIGAHEKIDKLQLINHLFHIIIGFVIFKFWNRSVENTADTGS